jgi:hypothetical protein
MVMIGASMFRSSSRMLASAMTKVTRVATRGSLAGPWPAARKRGSTPSRARACMVRGAATRLPRADDKVAAQMPA